MTEKTENLVRLKGYVKADPSIRYFSEINIKAYFPLVTYDIYRNQTETKRIPEFHNIVAWKQLAVDIENQIKADQFIEVEGRLKTSKYEKDGEMKLSVHIVLSSFKILEDAKAKESKTYPPTQEKNDLDELSDDFLSNKDEDVLPF